MDYSKGSGRRAEMALIPSERASKTIMSDVEFVLIHGFHVEISGDKGVSGPQTGGTPWDTPKGHLALGPGGECFAPPSLVQEGVPQVDVARIDPG